MPEKDLSEVHFDKYLTLPEGDSEVHYQLIGLIIHTGTANRGHYTSYVLSPNNEWWLYDDLPTALGESTIVPVHVPASQVFSQNKDAYAFFYRKVNTIVIDKKIIDMVIDCYGQNPTDKSQTPNSEFNNVAVALSFPTDKNSPGVISDECINIITQFKHSKINTVEKLKTFIIKYNLNLYFWRKAITKNH